MNSSILFGRYYCTVQSKVLVPTSYIDFSAFWAETLVPDGWNRYMHTSAFVLLPSSISTVLVIKNDISRVMKKRVNQIN